MDFSKNKPITGSWRDAVDNRTPFVRTAKSAAESSVILKGRTLIGRTSISHNSPELITITGLKQVAATIALGIQRPPNARNQLAYASEEKQEELKGRVVNFFDRFLPMCQPNYRLFADPERFGQNIIAQRSGACAYDTPVINLLANVHARWLEAEKPEERLAEYAGNIGLSKTAPENRLSRQGVYNPEKATYATAKEKKLWADASISMMEEADPS